MDELNGFPDRHPLPVKCVLWLFFTKTTDVSFDLLRPLLRHMGWREMTLEKDMGGPWVFVQRGWYDTTGQWGPTGIDP
jgi:hypothetical protein